MGRRIDPRRYAHLIGGLITALLMALGKRGLALLLFTAFLLYEVIEYLQLHDRLWLDIRDYVVGLFLGAFIVLVISAWRARKCQK